MHFTIEEVKPVDSPHSILRAELSHRETAEEMHEFARALGAELRRTGATVALLHVRHSLPIFKAEHYAGLTHLAANPAIRIALVANTAELRASHHYVELLTRQQGGNVRGFNDESSALEWLKTAVKIAGREGTAGSSGKALKERMQNG